MYIKLFRVEEFWIETAFLVPQVDNDDFLHVLTQKSR